MSAPTPTSAAPPRPTAVDVNLPMLLTVSVAGTLVVLALIWGLQAWFEVQSARELEVKSLAQVHGPLQDLRREQQQRIQTYRWIDPAKRVAAIPVERAMELLLKDRK